MATDRYTSVSEMLNELSDDKQFNKEFHEHVEKRRILKRLISLRCVKNVSQADVAEALGVGQSRVSKIENGTDDDLRFSDLRAYAEACGMNMRIVFSDQNLTIVDEVKLHAFRLKHLFERMAACAKQDKGIAKGVAAFFNDAFFNLVTLMQDAARKLPARTEDGKPHICIEVQELPINETGAIECECDSIDHDTEEKSPVGG